MLRAVLVSLSVGLLLARVDSAIAAESAYTKVDFDADCRGQTLVDGGGTWTCKGYKTYQIHFAEGDLRQSVFYGAVGPWHKDAFESFGRFNHAGETVEWRLTNGKPLATIRRWFLAADEGTSNGAEIEVLVVSKVGQKGVGDACVAGYVEASANPEANAIARKVADTVAPGFACRQAEPQWHGKRKNLQIEPMRSFGE